MKYVWKKIGFLLYWLLYPVWIVYFKVYTRRTRVLVIYKDEVLLIKGWLGNDKWSLPGGGLKSGEATQVGAIRELFEEVGIRSNSSALKSLGDHNHGRYGLNFHAIYFALELATKPALKLQFPEISDAAWYKLGDIRGRMLSRDAAFALKKYLPSDQTTLL